MKAKQIVKPGVPFLDADGKEVIREFPDAQWSLLSRQKNLKWEAIPTDEKPKVRDEKAEINKTKKALSEEGVKPE